MLYLSLNCEKNNNKQVEAGFGPFFKKRIQNFVWLDKEKIRQGSPTKLGNEKTQILRLKDFMMEASWCHEEVAKSIGDPETATSGGVGIINKNLKFWIIFK